MATATTGTAGRTINRRIDPALDKRRLVLFFAGLIVFDVGVLLLTRPELGGGEAELNKVVLGILLAPTVGAIWRAPSVPVWSPAAKQVTPRLLAQASS